MCVRQTSQSFWMYWGFSCYLYLDCPLLSGKRQLVFALSPHWLLWEWLPRCSSSATWVFSGSNRQSDFTDMQDPTKKRQCCQLVSERSERALSFVWFVCSGNSLDVGNRMLSIVLKLLTLLALLFLQSQVVTSHVAPVLKWDSHTVPVNSNSCTKITSSEIQSKLAPSELSYILTKTDVSMFQHNKT